MIFQLFYSALLFLNGILILNNSRFFRQIGFDLNHRESYSFKKKKLAELISSIRMVLKVPVIILNILALIYELLLG